jgi:hypothetical protein
VLAVPRVRGYGHERQPHMNDQLIELFVAHLGVEGVSERASSLAAEYGGDSPHLKLTTTVLAGYQLLLEQVPQDEALLLVGKAFHEPIFGFVHDGTRAALDSSPEPFATMVEFSKDREDNYFGSDFTFSRVEDSSKYLVDVHRCFYWDVLRFFGAPELGTVFCEFDAAWISAIDRERHGIRFSRPTTIARGGLTCPFHFFRG